MNDFTYRYKNVFITDITPCQATWPNSGSCVQVKFGVALNTTGPNYELTKPHLQEMWDTMSGNGLADLGLEVSECYKKLAYLRYYLYYKL